MKPLVAGNWKMNGLKASLEEAIKVDEAYEDRLQEAVDVMICPPALLISAMANQVNNIAVGAQDCHAAQSGAHTGDIAAEMVVDAGGNAIIVGHSERRADHGETNETVAAKAEAAKRAGATAIICVGETQGEREAGDALTVVLSQVKASIPSDAAASDIVIAYEPVWAIGTGLTPTVDDVEEMHTAIRSTLNERFGAGGDLIRILYGGSVKPGNAAELMAVPNVNGALVGGASLKADDFKQIFAVYG